MTGPADRREVEILGAVPQFFFEAIRRQEDPPDSIPGALMRSLASTVAEAIGPVLDTLESGAHVGEIAFTGGSGWEFRPEPPLSGGDEPDDSPQAIAERIRAGLGADLEAAGTCDEARDVLLDRARVLVDVQPSPFAERESGAIEAALADVSRQVAERMNELKCTTGVGARNRFNREFTDLHGAVTQARTVAEERAAEFIERWEDTDFLPRWTYRDIAEQVDSIVVEPTGRGAACRDILAALETLAQRLAALPTARSLLDTQQRGTPGNVKDIADGKAIELMDRLEEEGCFHRTEPDFELDDVRDLWRDVSLAIIRPVADIREEIEQFRRLIHNIQTPASERIGTQRAVPGTEEEALRREGEVSGVRIGGDGLLDDDLVVEFGPERGSRLSSRGGRLFADADGLRVETGPIVDMPADDVIERVRAIVKESVFLGDLEDGTRFGSFLTNEAGDELAEVRLSAGTPVRTDDVGDLVRRMKEADPGAGPPLEVGEWTWAGDEGPGFTWKREGLHLNPPATIQRPAETLADFATFVEVVKTRNRHVVRIRWTWDGDSEVSVREEFTVGDTQEKALELAVAMMEANERFPG